MQRCDPQPEWSNPANESTRQLTVLLVFFSFTGQTRRIAAALSEGFRGRGWNVVEAAVVVADSRYPLPFPWRRFWRHLLGWIPPQWLGQRCRIGLLPEITAEPLAADLICIGSPTWWLLPALPISSFLQGDVARELLAGRPFAVFAVARSFWRLNAWRVATLARRCGGRHVASRGFVFPGNQLQSFAALACYLRTGVSRNRWCGLPLHPYGLAADSLESARDFAARLAAHDGIRKGNA
jgi:hypothetical protein